MKKLRNISTEKKSVETYYGKLKVISARRLVLGQKVLTYRGIGTITNMDWDDINNEPIFIVSVRRGSLHERLKENQLAQYIVPHYKNGHWKELFLSFSDYDYILERDQLIIYRITKRGYAKLVPSDRDYYDKWATINRCKNGYNLYRELKKKGYEIERPIITKRMGRKVPDSVSRVKNREVHW
jgi:hypothetical protein